MSFMHSTMSKRKSKSAENMRSIRQQNKKLIKSYIKRLNVKAILVKGANGLKKNKGA